MNASPFSTLAILIAATTVSARGVDSIAPDETTDLYMSPAVIPTHPCKRHQPATGITAHDCTTRSSEVGMRSVPNSRAGAR